MFDLRGQLCRLVNYQLFGQLEGLGGRLVGSTSQLVVRTTQSSRLVLNMVKTLVHGSDSLNESVE